MTTVAVVGASHIWEKGMASLVAEAGFEIRLASDKEAYADCSVVHAPDLATWHLVRAVLEAYPHLPVVAVVDELDVVVAAEALKAGAATAVLESEASDRLASAIQAAVRGESVMHMAVAQSLAHHVPSSDDLSQWINDEEIEWLRLMATGSTVGDVAAEVGYSERAMFRHLKALYHRLGAQNRTEALLWAKQNRLLD